MKTMNRGKRSNMFGGGGVNKLYMDLKDIVRENALHFLPAKSLFKVQSVCRDWKLQISTPLFERNQSISFSSVGGLFCQGPGLPPMLIPLDRSSCGVPDPSLKFLPEAVDIRSSSNGLLLCQACVGDQVYYVCNPVTQKFKKLPQPSADHGPDPAVVLVFEPSLLNFEAEYKIVCAFQSADFDDATEFEIYSSTDGSWKTSGEICFASNLSTAKKVIYANGVTYFGSKHGGFLSYDVAKDRSQLMKSYYGFTGTLGVVNGKLCSATARGGTVVVSPVNSHSNTMEMNSNSKLWNNNCRITLDMSVVGAANAEPQTVLFAGGNAMVIQAGDRLFSYDLNTKVTREMSKPPTGYLTRLVPYVNSLVSI